MTDMPGSIAPDNRPVDVAAAVAKMEALIGSHLGSYLDACVHCGQCAQACHFHEATQDPRHTPALKLQPMTRVWRRSKAPFSGLRKALGLAPELTEQDLRDFEPLIFDTCTMCARCTVVCPMAIDIASVVAATRQAFVAAGLGPPDLLQAADNARDKGSPLGVTAQVLEDRCEWLADEHETEIPLDKKAEVLLTISSIEMMKYPDSVVAMAKMLNHAGVDWTLSTKGYEATNFGVLSGKGDVAKVMVTRIAEAADAVGAKTVIVPECGHAYGVLRWSGANILGRPLAFEVVHITEYLAALKRQGRLVFKPYAKSAVTYHDPCQISRRGGATADARYLLDGFATDFREMTPTGNYNWCCGGGGGVQAMARAAPVRHEVFRIKMAQVEATGAPALVSACANCRLTMDESKAALGWDKELLSIVEILADNLAPKQAA
jgi:Fe-S oxidoreductase